MSRDTARKRDQKRRKKKKRTLAPVPPLPGLSQRFESDEIIAVTWVNVRLDALENIISFTLMDEELLNRIMLEAVSDPREREEILALGVEGAMAFVMENFGLDAIIVMIHEELNSAAESDEDDVDDVDDEDDDADDEDYEDDDSSDVVSETGSASNFG